MGGLDPLVGRVFRSDFSSDGASKLGCKITEKLKEFMGEYTDDTLVEYVMVLLKNGRRRDEVWSELNVFLGDDDSNSFVSWLWDHLASNMDLYVQPTGSHPDDGSKAKPKLAELAPNDDLNCVHPESEREKYNRIFGSQHNHEQKRPVKGLAEPPLHQGSEIGNTHVEDKAHSRRTKDSPPKLLVHKKRNRSDSYRQTKRLAVFDASNGAPRRLLQFAVRDAVATARPSVVAPEPSLKRLRSVVSTPSGDSLVSSSSKRLKSVASVPYVAADALKAAAESAEDAMKASSSVNVFNRLGGTTDQMEISHDKQSNFRRPAVDDKAAMTNMESETGLAFDSASDDGYDDVDIVDHGAMDDSQTCSSHGYSVVKNADTAHKAWNKDQDQPVAAPNKSRKIVNISVNVNTWKPPHYQPSREVVEIDGRKAIHESAVKPDAQVNAGDNNRAVAGNGCERPAASSQPVSQKAAHATPAPSSVDHAPEDADSRTIFVSNVHFAATKDSLSRHFNKFGEVLKVVIITDAATGLPKGAAYIEFTRKEAAERALSSDGTSFLSRILKVVRRSTGSQEGSGVAPAGLRARSVRGPSLGVGRFGRVPYPRPSFRGRATLRPGSRSLQWKRGAHPAAPRSLTYVRPDAKTTGN